MSKQESDQKIAHRIAAKKASRKKDADRLKAGCSPEKIQRENSILPADFFSKRKISNFAEAVGH